jgi:2-iminobutanoate/2-iminopropanoate deaminase
MNRRHIVLSSGTLPPGMARKPFSDAVLAGDTLYVSGAIGIDPQTGRPPGDAAAEARMMLDHIRAVLGEAGMTMDDLVMVQIYSPDVELFATFNAVYLAYFDGPLPARAFLGSGPLLFGARFEATATAVAR